MTDVGTREKILNVALNLFGEKGFDGVSVREISKEAGVNISAINYYFQNKENLHREVIKTTIGGMTETVRSVYESKPDISTDEMALRIYEYFLENSQSFKLSFKMTIMDGDRYPCEVSTEDDFVGPPGGKLIFDAIKKEKPGAKDEDVVWAVRTIFSIVVHKALVVCSNCVKNVPGMDENSIKASISRLVKVVLGDL